MEGMLVLKMVKMGSERFVGVLESSFAVCSGLGLYFDCNLEFVNVYSQVLDSYDLVTSLIYMYSMSRHCFSATSAVYYLLLWAYATSHLIYNI